MAGKKKHHEYRGHLERRGDGYFWRVCVGGKYTRMTFETTSKSVAADRAKAEYSKLTAALKREQRGLPGQVRISALFDQFEREVVPTLAPGTQRSYKDSLKPLRTHFRDERSDPMVADLETSDVEAFLSWRRVHPLRGKVLANRTLQKDRTVLYGILDFAQRLGLCTGNAVALSKRPDADKRRPIILTGPQFELLLVECRDPVVRLYALTLGETGMRCESEALWLQWRDVDLEHGFLEVVSGRGGHRTKNGASRFVPMTKRLREAFERYLAEFGERGRWVFAHQIPRRSKGGRSVSVGDRIDSLRVSVMAAVQRADLPEGFHIHDLRHRRVTTWLAEGKSAVKVRQAMGHSDLATTMGYTHLTREDLRDLVDDEPEAPAPAPADEVAR